MNRITSPNLTAFRVRRPALCAVLVSAGMVAFGSTANSVGADTANDAFLQSLAGSWKGKGRLKANSTAKVEPVSCRMNAAWSGSSLNININCRGVDVSFSSSGVLKSGEPGNAVKGRWSGALGIGSADVFGVRNGNALSFSVNTRDRETGKAVKSSVLLQLAGNQLSNSVSSQDVQTGRRYQVLSLAMTR